MIKKLLSILILFGSSILTVPQKESFIQTTLPNVLIDDHCKIVEDHFITVKCSFKNDPQLKIIPLRTYIRKIPLEYVFNKDGTINRENNYECFSIYSIKFKLIIEATKNHIKDFKQASIIAIR